MPNLYHCATCGTKYGDEHALAAHALDVITEILSGNEWNADTVDAIAAEVKSTGREIRDTEEDEEPSGYYMSDGYRYGVMFSDGSVGDHWNGFTQRAQAARIATNYAALYSRDNITLARRKKNGEWERVVDGPLE